MLLGVGGIFVWAGHFFVQDGSHAQTEGCTGHQVSDYALVGLTFVDLSELLLVVDFDTDSVLQNILDVLLPLCHITVLILSTYNFLEV